MRLLMVVPYIGITYGGISKVVVDLLQSLSKVGIQVDLVTTNANGENTLDVSCHDWTHEYGCRIRYFPCWHSNDLILSYPFARWLTRHIKDYDLVHTHTMFAPMISWTHWLCQYFSIPYVMTPHGMLEPWALENKAIKKKLFFQLVENSSLANASAIQVIAKAELDQVNRIGFQSTTLVPNGLHPEVYRSLPSPVQFFKQYPKLLGKRLILFLGRIDPKKGLDLLAPAFRDIHDQFPNSHLVVAGPDSIDYLPHVKELFIKHECIEAVTFTGMLTGELKLSALSAAEIYVAPSFSEGFSISVLEGMASGLPCVITRGCNFPEAETAKVATVVDSEVDAIAHGIIDFLSAPEDAARVGEDARDFIFRNYTWESSAIKLKKLYLDIAKNIIT